MAVTFHKHKGGKTGSFQVRVGSKPAEWFNENNYPTRKLARAAANERYAELLAGGRVVKAVTCDAYTDRFLVIAEREPTKRTGTSRKPGSVAQLRTSANGFKRKWGTRLLASIERNEARDWVVLSGAPRAHVKFAAQLFNFAIEEGLVTRNVFAGLAPPTRGRSDLTPPSEEEWERLLAAWGAHGDYAPMGRALQRFAAASIARPGELFALEWTDVDFDAMRVNIDRGVYKGTTQLPKSNKKRRIVLTPEARDSLLSIPRVSRYVFVSKRGQRLSQPALSTYWSVVRGAAGLDPDRAAELDFYFVTKHRGVHRAHMVDCLPAEAIAGQAGWSVSAVESMLRIYGHADHGWEQHWDRLGARNVTQLRAVGE